MNAIFASYETRSESYLAILQRIRNMALMIPKQTMEESELTTLPKLAYLLRYLIRTSFVHGV